MALRASDDANVVEINQNEGRFPTFFGADGLGDLHLGSHLSSVNDTVTVIADMGDKRRSEVLDEDEPEPSEARFKSARCDDGAASASLAIVADADDRE